MNLEPKAVFDPPKSGGKVSNKIWSTVINALATALIIAVLALTVSMFVPPPTGATSSQTMLTVFTTIVGFLAGLFSPSPVNESG